MRKHYKAFSEKIKVPYVTLIGREKINCGKEID